MRPAAARNVRTGRFGLPLFCALVFLAAAGAGRAQLHWESTHLSITPKSTELQATAEFKFTNVGGAPLTIKEVHPDCGCVVPTPDSRAYSPGESGRVAVTFNVPGQLGDRDVPIQVISESAGKTSSSVVVLHVRIQELVTFSERFVYWKTEQPLNPRTVTITLAAGEDLTVKEVRAADPAFHTELASTSDPRRFTLKITPPAKRQRLATSVVVTTTPQQGGRVTEHRIVARVW